MLDVPFDEEVGKTLAELFRRGGVHQDHSVVRVQELQDLDGGEFGQ